MLLFTLTQVETATDTVAICSCPWLTEHKNK